MKIRKILFRIFFIIFHIYTFSVFIFGAIYWWKDVKKHDSFIRAISVSPVVGFLKATHWPYYEFFKGNDDKRSRRFKIDKNIEASVSSFFKGLNILNDSVELGKAHSNSTNNVADLNKIKDLLDESKNRFSKCDIKILNSIYDGWGDIISDKYIPGVDLIIISLGTNALGTNREMDELERMDVLRKADSLVEDANNWMDSNLDPLVLILTKRYGFEIERGQPVQRLP